MNDKTVIDSRITKEEFERWVENPVTQIIKKNLNIDVKTLLNFLLNNEPLQPGQNQLSVDGECKGRINAIQILLDTNYDMIKNLLDME